VVTVADWVEDTRAYLEGDRPGEVNQLDAAYTAGSGTMTLRYALGGVVAGSVLSVGTNTVRVLSTNQVSKTVTVQAGWNRSTDADAAAGTAVRVNPRFTDHRIVSALNGTLRTLSAPGNGLYQVGQTVILFDAAVQGYDLGAVTGLTRVLEVRRDTGGPSQAWARLRAGEWELQRSAPTADFPSGVALRINVGNVGVGWGPFGGLGVTAFNLQVVYAADFTEQADPAADVAATGIPPTAYDVPPLGAAVRLMAGREVPRNDTKAQGDARRSQEVPPGAVAASYRGLAALFAQRVGEEAARLRTRYPVGK